MGKLKTLATINAIVLILIGIVLAQYILVGSENYSSAIIISALVGLLGLRFYIEERDSVWRKDLITDVKKICEAQDSVISELKNEITKLNNHALKVNNKLELREQVNGKESFQEAFKRRF